MQSSMKQLCGLLTAGVALMLSGCATSPEWRHLRIQDKAASERQFTIDDGECTLLASSGAPPVSVVPAPAPTSANVTMQGSTYNTTTGQRTYGTYSGQVNTVPSGGFAGGFASGLSSGASLGTVIAARQAEERIHRSCMYSRGWTDKAPGVGEGEMGALTVKARGYTPPAKPASVYGDAQEEWGADTKEFLRFYPAYASGEFYERLNQKVKALAAAQAMTGPEYLLAALNQLRGEARRAPEDATDSGSVRATYVRAVQGSPADQAAMGLFYADRRDPRVPVDPVRSAHWSRKAALAGNAMGQLGYGIALFAGIGVKQDKVNAYRWVKLAESNGASVKSTLTMFESEMSPAELQAIR